MGPILRRSVVLASVAIAACSAGPTEPSDTTDEALKTDDHRAITTEYCVRAGFHDAFCARVAAEAFVVDAQEWERPWMHAMPGPGEGHCMAAAAVQDHLGRRGKELRAVLAKPELARADVEALAESLGRALHSIQDNCAHEGMTNPQHSWYSLRGACLHDGEDPDLAPSALACAANETKLVFRSLKDAFRVNGKDPASLWEAHDMAASQPRLAHVCEFLGEWQGWDGKDARWDVGITAPAFRETLVAALLSGSDTPRVCDGRPDGPSGASPIGVRAPRPAVQDRSDPTCLPVRILCEP